MYRLAGGPLILVSQKDRMHICKLRQLSLWENPGLALLFVRQARVELVSLKALRRRLRVSFRRVRGLGKSRRLWLTTSANYPLSLASKSKRMGKGSGLFERWVFRPTPLAPWLRLVGVTQARVLGLAKRLRSIFGPRLRFSSSLGSRPSWARAGAQACAIRQRKFY